MDARALAFESLDRWRRSRTPADDLLDQGLDRARLTGADRALATELFYGCLRQKLALDFLRRQFATQPPRPLVGALLDLGLYQLFFLEKIPAHAAVHETVALAKRHASAAEARFVNAILRRAGREQDDAAARLRALRESEPWVYYSQPRWLFERWEARWGREPALALAEWNNTPPPVYVRLNTLKCPHPPGSAGSSSGQSESRTGILPVRVRRTDRQDACPTAETELALEPSPFHPLCWRVVNPARIFQTKSWAAGEWYVQDPSTLVAVDLLDPQPGESVLDLCAAPGGKTTYIAQKMLNRGKIIAADAVNARLGLVGENCRRLGVTIVATLACDGTRLGGCLRAERFDRVLVDAPCSNTGVLRRRVDLRWRLEEPEIKRLARLQQKLLAAAAALTRPGGVLVYSTCSLEPEENEQVAARFHEAHPQFVCEGTRATFPPRDGVDGAFAARWRRQTRG